MSRAIPVSGEIQEWLQSVRPPELSLNRPNELVSETSKRMT